MRRKRRQILHCLTLLTSTACRLPMFESSAAIATPAMAAKASRAAVVRAIFSKSEWSFLVLKYGLDDLCPDLVDTWWSLAGEVGQREKYGRTDGRTAPEEESSYASAPSVCGCCCAYQRPLKHRCVVDTVQHTGVDIAHSCAIFLFYLGGEI